MGRRGEVGGNIRRKTVFKSRSGEGWLGRGGWRGEEREIAGGKGKRDLKGD